MSRLFNIVYMALIWQYYYTALTRVRSLTIFFFFFCNLMKYGVSSIFYFSAIKLTRSKEKHHFQDFNDEKKFLRKEIE